MAEEGRREVWIDLLKIICVISIVVIHRSGNSYGNYSETGLWYRQLFCHGATRFAVPCFMFISGYLLMRKDEGLGAAFRRCLKTTAVFLVWSLLIALFTVHSQKAAVSLVDLVKQIPVKHVQGHLWYIYELIWFQMLAPLFRETARKAGVKISAAFVLGALLAPVSLDFIYRLCFPQSGGVLRVGWQTLGIPELATFYMGWLLAALGPGIDRRLPWLLALAGFGLMLGLSWWTSARLNAAYQEWFFQNRLPAVLFGSGVFLLFFNMESRLKALPARARALIAKLASVSLGVFYIHVMMLQVVSRHGASGVRGALVAGALCFALCYVVSGVPGLKKLVS